MYYVAGKNYNEMGKVTFKLVHPTAGHIYITKNRDGLKTTVHHASLYEVKEMETRYRLKLVQHRRPESPIELWINKESKLGRQLAASIKYAEDNDMFYP